MFVTGFRRFRVLVFGSVRSGVLVFCGLPSCAREDLMSVKCGLIARRVLSCVYFKDHGTQ